MKRLSDGKITQGIANLIDSLINPSVPSRDKGCLLFYSNGNNDNKPSR